MDQILHQLIESQCTTAITCENHAMSEPGPSLLASSRPSSQSKHRTLRSSVVPRSLWQISQAFVGWKHDEVRTEQPRSNPIQESYETFILSSGKSKNLQLDPTWGWHRWWIHACSTAAPFCFAWHAASEFMRSHRLPALHRCNAHCCKGCRARSFYCHPWSGQSTNLGKNRYARVTCRCQKVVLVKG